MARATIEHFFNVTSSSSYGGFAASQLLPRILYCHSRKLNLFIEMFIKVTVQTLPCMRSPMYHLLKFEFWQWEEFQIMIHLHGKESLFSLLGKKAQKCIPSCTKMYSMFSCSFLPPLLFPQPSLSLSLSLSPLFIYLFTFS